MGTTGEHNVNSCNSESPQSTTTQQPSWIWQTATEYSEHTLDIGHTIAQPSRGYSCLFNKKKALTSAPPTVPDSDQPSDSGNAASTRHNIQSNQPWCPSMDLPKPSFLPSHIFVDHPG